MGSLRDDLAVPGLEVVETHISWVFLAEREVWKVKKPVSLGFLDFSTAEKRKAVCQAEVRLNRRLAPDVYRGVVPITLDSSRRHCFGGSGVPVDWAVHMDRLADVDRADVRLGEGRLTYAHVTRIAEHIAAFHARARSDEVCASFGAVEAITRIIRDNLELGREAAIDLLGETEAHAIEVEQLAFLTDHSALFEDRIRTGHIREGHGDLRLEHVYLADDSGDESGIRVLDCIEFNDRFRFVDVCSDVAFFSMDLAYHGRGDLAELFLARYAQVSNDYDLYSLVGFYVSYRAYVRGMVHGILAADEGAPISIRGSSKDAARRYYRLALDSLRARPQRSDHRFSVSPVVLAVGGIVASGKSTVADGIGRELMAPVVSSDRTRKWLLGVEPTTPVKAGAGKGDSAASPGPWTGAYSAEVTEAVYAEVFKRARSVLQSGRPVAIDASFRSLEHREAARQLARDLGVPFLFVECQAPSDIVRERLRQRDKEPSVSDARAEFLDDFVASWEPVDELDPSEHLVLDTSGSIEENVEAIRGAS
jgi:aminoglycoside phosphotransferase family enzyme/predicted kinase